MTNPSPRAKPAPVPAVPDALLAQWRYDSPQRLGAINVPAHERHIAESAWAAAWGQREALAAEEVREAEQRGADAELEACCKWLEKNDGYLLRGCHETLRAARRPAPPTLRERALAELRSRRIATTDNGSVIISGNLLELTLAALQEGAE